MKNITLIPSEKAFIDCANRELNLTTEEAGLLLGYIVGHGCGVYLDEADTIVTTILNKSFFWQKASVVPMTERQTQMLNLFLEGYEAKITSKTWATLAKCSKDTAIRDIQDLIDKNILKEDIPGAKRPSYSIVYDAEDLTQFFTEVSITEENGIPYLKALFKGKKPICERVLKLDAERYEKGDLPLANLLSKYCSYIAATNRDL